MVNAKSFGIKAWLFLLHLNIKSFKIYNFILLESYLDLVKCWIRFYNIHVYIHTKINNYVSKTHTPTKKKINYIIL